MISADKTWQLEDCRKEAIQENERLEDPLNDYKIANTLEKKTQEEKLSGMVIERESGTTKLEV